VSEMSLATIEANLAQLKTKYQMDSGKLELFQKQLNDKIAELTQALRDIEVWQRLKILFGQMSEFAREQLKQRIQGTVTSALQAILLRDDISFEIEMWFGSDGKPNARWKINSPCGDVMVQTEPEDGNGGGVTDVVSLALRAALLELSRPKPAGLLFLDESGKHISSEYLPNVADFLKRYAQTSGRQIVLITHQTILADIADKGYKVNQTGGISEVTEV
jgi:DNA repair exonuclease SbcCD ATPase subunit